MPKFPTDQKTCMDFSSHLHITHAPTPHHVILFTTPAILGNKQQLGRNNGPL
jgi:hypothetical protein